MHDRQDAERHFVPLGTFEVNREDAAFNRRDEAVILKGICRLPGTVVVREAFNIGMLKKIWPTVDAKCRTENLSRIN